MNPNDYERTDSAGRKWEYIGRAKSGKVWSTTVNGVDFVLKSSFKDGGWLLIIEGQPDRSTDARLIEPAIEFAQAYLPGGVQGFVPTDKQVRNAASGNGTSVGTAGFDAWLARHDRDLIQTLTSIAKEKP